MLPRLVAFLSALSLLLAVAAVVLWVRQWERLKTPGVPGTTLDQERYYPPLRSMQAHLGWRVPVIRFDAVRLDDALEFAQDINGLRVVINWRAIEAAGVRRDTPITISSKNERIRQLIEKIVESAGLAYVVYEATVYISTPQDLSRIGQRARPHPRIMSPGDELAAFLLAEPARHREYLPETKHAGLAYEFNQIGADSGLKVDVDWAALRAAGVTPETDVPADRWSSLDGALTETCYMASPSADLQYEIRDGGIFVSTRTGFARAQRLHYVQAVGCMTPAAIAFLIAMLVRRRRGTIALLGTLCLTTAAGWALWNCHTDGLSIKLGAERWSVGAAPRANPLLPTAQLSDMRLAFLRRPTTDLVDWPPPTPYVPNEEWGASPASCLDVHETYSSHRPSPRNFIISCRNLTLALFVLPLIWMAVQLGRQQWERADRRRRISGRRCPRCDYDVRATRQRCPECGEVLAIAV